MNKINLCRIPVVVIFGPTAIGKTQLVKTLFGKGSTLFGKVQVISADSVAVYQGVNIGSAKPDAQLQKEVPHHLIDIVPIQKEFGVQDFAEQADNLCRLIWQKGQIPIVVGGTGFYLKNFLMGLPLTPACNEKIREQIQKRLLQEGKEALYEELSRIDPISAKVIHPNDEYRITRALEIFFATGKPRSSYPLPQKMNEKYDFCTIILTCNKEELKERIRLRVGQMLENGLENEIEMLVQNGAKKDMPGLKGIGYKEYFSCSTSFDFQKAVIHDTIEYAKRQMTYMKNIPNAFHFEIDSTEAKKKIQEFCLLHLCKQILMNKS